MRIRCRPSRRRLERITLNLASMIDVTFLLLIYFMVSTVLARPEDRLSPTLQTEREAIEAGMSDFQPQIVEVLVVDGAPAYRVGARVLRTRAELVEVLGGLPKTVGVFVKVFDQVSVGFAVVAVQTARDAGFEQVTYVPAG
ncbi:MAG: ExbD/TolR family protein [Planctomycetota bacterium]|jgi:biopolymer transport protein ExbD